MTEDREIAALPGCWAVTAWAKRIREEVHPQQEGRAVICSRVGLSNCEFFSSISGP